MTDGEQSWKDREECRGFLWTLVAVFGAFTVTEVVRPSPWGGGPIIMAIAAVFWIVPSTFMYAIAVERYGRRFAIPESISRVGIGVTAASAFMGGAYFVVVPLIEAFGSPGLLLVYFILAPASLAVVPQFLVCHRTGV